jgi:hypothetical protein
LAKGSLNSIAVLVLSCSSAKNGQLDFSFYRIPSDRPAPRAHPAFYDNSVFKSICGDRWYCVCLQAYAYVLLTLCTLGAVRLCMVGWVLLNIY